MTSCNHGRSWSHEWLHHINLNWLNSKHHGYHLAEDKTGFWLHSDMSAKSVIKGLRKSDATIVPPLDIVKLNFGQLIDLSLGQTEDSRNYGAVSFGLLRELLLAIVDRMGWWSSLFIYMLHRSYDSDDFVINHHSGRYRYTMTNIIYQHAIAMAPTTQIVICKNRLSTLDLQNMIGELWYSKMKVLANCDWLKDRQPNVHWPTYCLPPAWSVMQFYICISKVSETR